MFLDEGKPERGKGVRGVGVFGTRMRLIRSDTLFFSMSGPLLLCAKRPSLLEDSVYNSTPLKLD